MKAQLKSLKRPIVMYAITQDCQMQCRHCYNESGIFNPYTPGDDELISNIEKLSCYAGTINFTGGEPFKVNILPRLLSISSANKADNIITTNGLRFLESDARTLLEKIEPNLYMMKIGMMGANAKTNDYVRGNGHFDAAMKAFNLLADYNFIRCAKVSIDKHNMNEIEAFCRFSLKHEIQQLVFGQLVNIGRASRFMSELALDGEDMLRVDEKLERAKEKYKGELKIARHCTLSGLCQKPGEFYIVTAKGAVSPCLMREDLAIGDISKEETKELFERVDKARLLSKNHRNVRDFKTPEILRLPLIHNRYYEGWCSL